MAYLYSHNFQDLRDLHSCSLLSRHLTPTSLTTSSIASKAVNGTANAHGSVVGNMGVNHHRLHVLVAQEFLDRSEILVSSESMSGEGVPEGMARGSFRENSHPRGATQLVLLAGRRDGSTSGGSPANRGNRCLKAPFA